MMPIVLDFGEAVLSVCLTVTFVAAGVTWSVTAYPSVRGTTLRGPWTWSLISMSSLCGAELLAAVGPPDAGLNQVVRFAAAATTLLPMMSLLGAKRPQHRGWHFVVLTLWVVLLLPVLENIFLRPDAAPGLRGIRAHFMLMLVLVGVLNYVATRFWAAALTAGAAQLFLLSAHLSALQWLRPPVGTTQLAGLALLLVAFALARFTSGSRRKDLAPLDRLWLDFRDQFGVLWSLRFAERLNATARLAGWPLQLRWSGFRMQSRSTSLTELPDDVARQLEQALQNLLRRFVSQDWIARRVRIAVD